MAEDPNAWWATRKDLSMRNLNGYLRTKKATAVQKRRIVWLSLILLFFLVGLMFFWFHLTN